MADVWIVVASASVAASAGFAMGWALGRRARRPAMSRGETRVEARPTLVAVPPTKLRIPPPPPARVRVPDAELVKTTVFIRPSAVAEDGKVTTVLNVDHLLARVRGNRVRT